MANFMTSQWTGNSNTAVAAGNYGTPGYSDGYQKYGKPRGQVQAQAPPHCYQPAQNMRVATQQQRYQCFNCLETGHFKRDCPYLLESQMNQQNGQKHARRATQQRSHAACVYLKIKIRGKIRFSLVDTGCEVTVIPARLVEKHRMQRTTTKLLAANGTKIPLLGVAKVHGLIGNTPIEISGLVSEHVMDIMLGFD